MAGCKRPPKYPRARVNGQTRARYHFDALEYWYVSTVDFITVVGSCVEGKDIDIPRNYLKKNLAETERLSL